MGLLMFNYILDDPASVDAVSGLCLDFAFVG